MNVYVYFFLLAELTALLTGIYFFKKIKNKFLFLFIYVMVGFLMENTLNILYIAFHIRDNRMLTHFYFPVEFLILALFYLPHLTPIIKKKWILLIIGLYLAYSFINPIFIQDFGESSKLRTVNSIILIFFSIAYFYRLMIELKSTSLLIQPMFWINTAVLLYFSSILFYYILLSLLLANFSREFVKTFGLISGMFMVIFYLLIAFSFYLEGRQQIKMKHASLK